MRKVGDISGFAQEAKQVARRSFAIRRHSRSGSFRIGIVMVSIALCWLSYKFVPLLLWAYNVEQAGALIEQGMAWPEPRLAESLPSSRDQHKLERAAEYLSIAIRWRPEHAHAYRLLGRVHVARGEWAAAATALEQARMRAPRNPLLAWEAGLIYERMQQLINEAPFDSLLEALSTARLDAPTIAIETPFCRHGEPQSCYFGTTLFYQPYAAFPDGPMVRSQVVFLHAPAEIEQRLAIPADRTGLRFVVGLDPSARSLGTDGATFRIWVSTEKGPKTLVYEHTIDRATALEGWVPGWADLSDWSGQTITLTFGIDAGRSGNSAGDWYGWGNIGLTTLETAQYSSLLPRLRMLEAWRAAGLSSEQIKIRSE